MRKEEGGNPKPRLNESGEMMEMNEEVLLV